LTEPRQGHLGLRSKLAPGIEGCLPGPEKTRGLYLALPSTPRARKGSAMKRWQQVLLDETAASSVEYGLLLAGIALVVFASIMTLGQVVLNRFYAGADKLFQ
jgi:Flp pilus assembly pilin Flp